MTGQRTACAHEHFEATCSVERLVDTGMFSTNVTIRCSECKEPFRFLGVPAGLSRERPMVSVDGLELRAPIEPQGEPRLFTRATYQMPGRPVTRESES